MTPLKKSPELQEDSQGEHSEATHISPPPATQLHECQCNSNAYDKLHWTNATVTGKKALEDTITSGVPVGSPHQIHGLRKHQENPIAGVFYDSSNRKSHVTYLSPTPVASQPACYNAQTVELSKVSQSDDKGETLTDVVINSNVAPITCPLPHQTTAQDMQDELLASERAFRGDCGNETTCKEDRVDDLQNTMSDFEDHLHGLHAPVQSEDTAHNTNPGATALVMPQMTATAAVFVSTCPISNDNELCTPR